MPRAAVRPKLAKRVYLGLRFGAPLPDEFIEWQIALDTGWTLEYIQSMTMQDYHNYLLIKYGAKQAGVK